MTTTTDALQAAIDYLGALEVAPGRYAFSEKPDDISVRWYTFGTDDLTQTHYLQNLRMSLRPVVKATPAWWTPERRYAVVIEDGAGAVHLIRSTHNTLAGAMLDRDAALASDDWTQDDHEAYVVTADLETGQEVIA